jgi:hypothetical protein
MMNMKHIILLTASLLIMVSCEKRINLKPTEGPPVVIIQGYLYADSTARVMVSNSTNYLSSVVPAGISTALVVLSDNNGNTDTLAWNTQSQEYVSSKIKGVINAMYTLNVQLSGQTYTATSILQPLQKADSITVLYTKGIRKSSYQMQLYANISTSSLSYYLFKGYSNDSLLDKSTQVNCADNHYLNGNLDGYKVGYNTFVPGDSAMLYIFSLTQPAYNFWVAADLQLNNDGGYFSTPPANVPSMFNNGAVGVFQCSELQILKKYVLPQ